MRAREMRGTQPDSVIQPRRRSVPWRSLIAMLAALLLPGGLLALTPGPASASSLSPDATAAAVQTDYWPAFHHDATHKGVSADQAIAASTAPSLGLKWKVPVGGGPHGHAPVYASPAVAYNT